MLVKSPFYSSIQERFCRSPDDLEAVCSIELMKLSDWMKNNTVPEESHHVMPVPEQRKRNMRKRERERERFK